MRKNLVRTLWGICVLSLPWCTLAATESFTWFRAVPSSVRCASVNCGSVAIDVKHEYYTATADSSQLDAIPYSRPVVGFDRTLKNGHTFPTSLNSTCSVGISGSAMSWRQIAAEVGKCGVATQSTILTDGSLDQGMGLCTYVYESVSGTWGSEKRTPPGVTDNCVYAPPPNHWCAMTKSTVTLDYGILNSSAASGSSSNAELGVSCTSSSLTYRLRLASRLPYVSLNNGMRADLAVDGGSLSSKVFAGSQASISLVGTLSGTATKTGSFSGSDVIMVEYQ